MRSCGGRVFMMSGEGVRSEELWGEGVHDVR